MLRKMLVFTTLATVGLGFVGGPKQTAMELLTIVTVQGTSIAATRISDTLDPKMSRVIEFTAWCLCATSIISVIKIGFTALTPFVEFVTKVVGGIKYVINFFANIG